MTSWRDARLQRALEDAPDGELRPDERTRQAIRDFAHKAVTPAPVAVPVAAPWWKKFWPDTGATRMPWNAALATVVLATLVTVIWHDKPVPGADTESSRTDKPAPAAVAPSPVKPSPEATAPQPAPEVPAAAAKPKRAPVEAARERRAETTVDALHDKQERNLAKSGPAAQGELRQAPAKSADVAAGASTGSARTEGGLARTESSPPVLEAAPAPAAAPAPSPAAAPPPAARVAPVSPAAPPAPVIVAPAPAPAAAAPPAQRAFARDASLRLGLSAVSAVWTGARIEQAGRTVEIPRAQANALAGLLSVLERDPRTTQPLDAPVSARIELRVQGAAAQVIEIAGTRLRWQAGRREEGAVFTTQPETAQLQALQAELDRLLGR